MADAEMQARFAPPGRPLEPDVVAELQSMMRLHDLPAEDLYYKWDSYCMKLELDAQDVSLSNVRGLKQSIQDELDRSAHRHSAQQHARPERRVNAAPKAAADVFGLLDGLLPSTPAAARAGRPPNRGPGSASIARRRAEASSPAIKSSPAKDRDAPPSSFSDRANAGEVVEVLNDHLAPAEPPAAPYAEARIKLASSSDQKKLAYRPLAMKLSEASEIVDDRIDDFAALVQEHHGLDDAAFGSAASQGTTEIIAVGRIASDAPVGRLNAASLVLETSRRTGGGLRVRLNTRAVPGWTCFPGQVVALRGINADGSEFVVAEVLELPLLSGAASTPAALAAHRERLGGGPDAMDADGAEPAPLAVLFASGPYTADDNLDYEPLHALCDRATEASADALVLAGPFLDVDHPLLATGDFDLPDDADDADTATMATVFRHLVLPPLARLAAASPHTTVLLVPSVRDLIAKHVSWPQDAAGSRKELGLPRSVRVVVNPMTVWLNEAVVAVSSQDVLSQLRAEHLPPATDGGDLMGRLVRFLVQQRHYFPLFPPADRATLSRTGTNEGLATGAVLDVSYLKLGEMVNVRPDVMVVPSALPPFAKVVDSVLAINPGYLSRRKGAGTYARMTLHAPRADADAAADAMLIHRVFDRARVEIVRI